MGRPLSGNTSHQARRSPPGDQRWRSSEQLLKFRTSSQVLPIGHGCRELRQPPFVQALSARHVTLCTEPGTDPVRSQIVFSIYSFLLVSMSIYIYMYACHACLGYYATLDSNRFRGTIKDPCPCPLFYPATARTRDPSKDPAPARS